MLKNINLRIIGFTLVVLFHFASIIITLLSDDTMPVPGFLGFSFSYLILILSAIVYNKNYAIKFFSLFLYLGIFMKICAHAIFAYPFVEPIGNFKGSPDEWNEFFFIASVGALATSLCAVLIQRFLIKKRELINREERIISIVWNYPRAIFVLILVSIFVVAMINSELGINISGLAAITVLPWPLNALIGFFLYMGFAVAIAVFAYHEFKLTQKLSYTIVLVFVEGFLSSISILSRGLFLFHFLPFVYCLYLLREQIRMSLLRIFQILCLGAVCFAISGFMVTNARSSLYDGYEMNKASYNQTNLFKIQSGKSSEIYSQFVSFTTQISGLVVDRWIGAEGLMAVISYPNKDVNLIYETIVRVPKPGTKDIFEMMNNSFYPTNTNYVFTSLPGPMAFFYYAGKPWLVFVGMMGFLLLLYLLHTCTYLIINSLFLEMQTAFYFGVSFMQFGISPRPLLISYFMLFCLLICFKLVAYASNYVSRPNGRLIAD